MIKKPDLKIILLVIAIACTLNTIGLFVIYFKFFKSEPVHVEHVNEVSIQEVLYSDILPYKHLSDDMKHGIVNQIIKSADEQGVDPRLVYSFIKTESTFRVNSKHAKTYVRQLKKDIQAIGLGGVVWDFWSEVLLTRTSLKSEKDLKDWRKNIEATAAILSYLSDFRMHPKAKDIKESVAARYYGVYTVDYVEKINFAYAKLS